MLAVPFGAGVVVAILGPGSLAAIRWISLAATVTCLVIAALIAVSFAQLRSIERPEVPHTAAPGARPPTAEATHVAEPRPSGSGSSLTFHPQYVTRTDVLQFGSEPEQSIQFYVGVDGLNVWLVALTAVLMVPAVLVSWTSIRERVNEYFAWLLALETGMLGLFLAFDIVLFYVFFELTLIPLFFIIGIWGGPERRYAARKFFVYTLAGSLITLLGVLGIVLMCYSDPRIHQLTFSIPDLVHAVNQNLDELGRNPGEFAEEIATWQRVELLVFLALAVGFAIKVPLVPLHTWLPLAHVEAPTAGSVILAGVLLKIGAYGFLRLCIPLTPDAASTIGVPLIGSLAVIGIVYGALCALAQDDIKRLVAYSSVSHLGFCMLGMFALNVAGLSGSLLQMVNHGLSTGALFLLVGMLYDRYHTRLLNDYGGMGERLRLLACFMVFFCLTSIGLPGLNGFVGEVLVLMGIYDFEMAHMQWPTLAVVAASGVVLGAWYLLTMLRRVFFGPVKEPEHEGHGLVGDLNLRELAALLPVAALCVAIGVYPQPVLRTSRLEIETIANLAGRAEHRAGTSVTATRLPAAATKFAADLATKEAE
jgi:NADH-quinone oxidoreductase subunit M